MPDLNKNWKIVAQGGGEHGSPTGTEIRASETHPAVGHAEEHDSSNPLAHHTPWEFSLSGLVIAVSLIAFAAVATRNMTKIPHNKLQNIAERVVEGINDFCEQSIGPGGKRFGPFIGTLFLYILCSNLIGALPLVWRSEGPGKVGSVPLFGPLGSLVAPTANLSMNFAMAIIVFITFNVVALQSQGLVGRLKHLWGPIPWLGFLLFPLEVISELIRPLSLSFRLFGNIFGEEMMVAAIIGLVASIPFVGWVPLHLPLLIFGLLTAGVQALVFCLLTCIYLRMATDTGDHGDHGHDAHPADDHGDHAHTATAAAH